MADGRYLEEDRIDHAADRAAVRRMLRLHEALSDAGGGTQDWADFLVRLAYCLVADETGIFAAQSVFTQPLLEHAKDPGADVASWLAQSFETLATRREHHPSDEDAGTLAAAGAGLLGERIVLPAFDARARARLVDAVDLDWAQVSPAVLGELVQSVMDDEHRRQLGAHFTSEKSVRKVVGPLFLDGLQARFETLRGRRDARSRDALVALQREMASLALLDPACGCGDFLLAAYRQLRLLETLVLEELATGGVDVASLPRLGLRQLHGIEIAGLSARVAAASLHLLDHVMDVRLARKLGRSFARDVSRSSPRIHHADALELDWNAVLPAPRATAVFGNPPFVGKKEQTARQKADVRRVWGSDPGVGVLDYAACWYRKAAEYVSGTQVPCAFVSTSSITQGEQVAALWPELMNRWRIDLHFAHRTFNWHSAARGTARVHVVIIGFGSAPARRRLLFDYDDVDGEPTVTHVPRINPYLVSGPDVWLHKRSSPFRGGLPVSYGSFALDDGHFTLSQEDHAVLLDECPGATPFLRPFVGGKELIQGRRRWCLWLCDVDRRELDSLPAVLRRVEAVEAWRRASHRKRTRELADTPTRFAEIRQPRTRYLAFPTLSSVRRRYVPVAFLDPDTVASNQIYVVADATSFHFGVMTSAMHMAWVKVVCGRFKSDYRYSAGIVYNNFPWPRTPAPAHRDAVERAAEQVLAARDRFEGASLASLYDPGAMPPALVEAHARLDRAVDRCYGATRFEDDRRRVEHLFEAYAELERGRCAHDDAQRP